MIGTTGERREREREEREKASAKQIKGMRKRKNVEG